MNGKPPRDPAPVEGTVPPDEAEGHQTPPLRLSKYVRLPDNHIVKRSSLPDFHEDSWPSRARALRGVEKLPDNWRDCLTTIPPNKEKD